MINDKIEDILFDGTKEEIEKCRCECGGKLSFLYQDDTFKVFCDSCKTVESYYKCPVPNCISLFDK